MDSEKGRSEMERERRTVMLAIVTLLMYGLVSVMGNGPFAFFPVNEIAFFCIAVYFSFFNFKLAQVSYVLMLLLASLGMASNQIFLSFFMDNQQLQAFYEHPALQYIYLSTYILMLAEITRFYILTKWKILAYTFPLVAGIFIAGIWFESLLLITAALVLFVGLLYYAYKKNMTGIAIYSKSLFYLWYFLAFLKLTALLTIELYNYKFG